MPEEKLLKQVNVGLTEAQDAEDKDIIKQLAPKMSHGEYLRICRDFFTLCWKVKGPLQVSADILEMSRELEK